MSARAGPREEALAMVVPTTTSLLQERRLCRATSVTWFHNNHVSGGLTGEAKLDRASSTIDEPLCHFRCYRRLRQHGENRCEGASVVYRRSDPHRWAQPCQFRGCCSGPWCPSVGDTS